jgi:hypothetical protein
LQFPVILLSGALLLGGAGLTVSDYSRISPERTASIRLGRLYLLDDFLAVEDARSKIGNIGLAGAAKVFNPALERNPASAYRWCDVGEALSDNGNEKLAAYCYRRAGELAPDDPNILLAIGDYYARTENPTLAVEPFSRILALTGAPDGDFLTGNVFSYYERIGIRENKLLGPAIPDGVNARAYVRYLMRETNPAAVREVWMWTQDKSYDDDRLTADSVNYLLLKQKIDWAEEGWMRRFSNRSDGYPRSTRLFNGGFERELTGAVLDWHFDGFDGVKVRRDSQTPFEGKYSLRIDFTGNDNPDFHHVTETAFVRPGRYHFEAHVRTSAITGSEGVRFRIQGVNPKMPLLAETMAVSGTADWSRLESDFEVPPGTAMVEVEVTRRRSLRIDNQLTGTAWIDSVTLRPRSIPSQ